MTLQPLPLNAALPLDQPALAWMVCEGSVDVFRERFKQGEPSSPRRHLFTCPTHSLLLGAQETEGDSVTRLVAVAVLESRLEAVELPGQGSPAEPVATTVVSGIEGWIQGVAQSCSANDIPGPLQRAHPGGRAQLSPGESLLAAPGAVVWAKVVAGSVTWLDGVLPTAGPAQFLPLCDRLGLIATADSALEIVATGDLAPGELAAGLAELHRYLFTNLDHAEARAARAALERSTERDRVAALETAAVLETWRSVFTPRAGLAARETPLRTAIAIVAHEMRVEMRFPPLLDESGGADEAVAAIARLSRVRMRIVKLSGTWWQGDAGPLLAFCGEERRPVALLRRSERYVVWDPADGSKRPVDAAVSQELQPDAVAFIRPFPEAASSLLAVAKFAMTAYWKETVVMLLLAAAVSILGMFSAPAMGLIVDHCIPAADRRLLLEIGMGLLVVGIGNSVLSLSQSIVGLRGMSGLTAQLQTAIIDRLLRLKAGFFRQFSSGDLLNRSMMIAEISQEMTGSVLGGLFSGAMSLLNLGLCLYYSPKLAMIAFLAAAITAGVTAGMSKAIRGRAIRLEVASGKLFGMAVQLVNGITKLRVAGAEQRAFNHWARQYGTQLKLRNELRKIDDWSRRFDTILESGSTICLFAFATAMLMAGQAAAGGALPPGAPAILTLGAFLAFNAAFHGLINGITGLCTTVVGLSDNWAKKDLVEPLLKAELEVDSGKIDPGPLVGRLAVDNVTFRYREDGPLILDKVSLQAEPGEFIALVGPSGSGKSTLLRLLLGFELPSEGTVLYDRQDLAGLDISAVRRQIGTVLQNGQITAGSIFTNITASARGTMEEAMETARDAGFAEDIEQMPMQLHTIVNEAGRNLSGGQRQRLLIARALFTNPRILFFDEATSALDNRTQRIVSDSVKRRRVTRVVVAHRLSTIKDADRIYVLEAGKVTQSGTYAELAETPGLFQRMVARQTV